MAAKRKGTRPVKPAMRPEQVQFVLDLRRGSRSSRQGTGRRPQLDRRAAIDESRRAA
jgi:hypothetical protein